MNDGAAGAGMSAGRAIRIALGIAVAVVALAAFVLVLGDVGGSPTVELQQQSDYDRQRQDAIDTCIAQNSQGAGDVAARARCELDHPGLIRAPLSTSNPGG